MSYKLHRVGLSDAKAKQLWKSTLDGSPMTLKLTKQDVQGSEYPLMLTSPQANKLEKMRAKGVGGNLNLSKRQLVHLNRVAKTIDQEGSGFIKDIFSTLGKIVAPIAESFAPGSSDVVEKIGDKIGDAIEGSVNKKKFKDASAKLMGGYKKDMAQANKQLSSDPKSANVALKGINDLLVEKLKNLSQKIEAGDKITSDDTTWNTYFSGNGWGYGLNDGIQTPAQQSPNVLPYGSGMCADGICDNCNYLLNTGSGPLLDLVKNALRAPTPSRMPPKMPKVPKRMPKNF